MNVGSSPYLNQASGSSAGFSHRLAGDGCSSHGRRGDSHRTAAPPPSSDVQQTSSTLVRRCSASDTRGNSVHTVTLRARHGARAASAGLPGNDNAEPETQRGVPTGSASRAQRAPAGRCGCRDRLRFLAVRSARRHPVQSTEFPAGHRRKGVIAELLGGSVRLIAAGLSAALPQNMPGVTSPWMPPLASISAALGSKCRY